MDAVSGVDVCGVVCVMKQMWIVGGFERECVWSCVLRLVDLHVWIVSEFERGCTRSCLCDKCTCICV